jgi:hypothetical protein
MACVRGHQLKNFRSTTSAAEVTTKHIQRMFRPGDDKKIDDFCLESHKEFNRERQQEPRRSPQRARKGVTQSPVHRVGLATPQ